MGTAIADALQVVGLLAIEMFVLASGEVLVNELAPRPHNSFHHTIEGCATSQFEQLIRAVCDLPLGATDVVRPAAIANILGDAWSHPDGRRTSRPRSPSRQRGSTSTASAIPRPARKMGHLAAVADTPLERAAVLESSGAQLRGLTASRPPPDLGSGLTLASGCSAPG